MSKVGMLGVVKNAVYEIQCTIHRRCSSFLHVRVLVPVELSKRLSGPLKLVLQMVVMHHVGAWNRTRGLLQGSKCFYLWAISPAAHRAL